MDRILDHLAGHIVLVGCGAIGRRVDDLVADALLDRLAKTPGA